MGESVNSQNPSDLRTMENPQERFGFPKQNGRSLSYWLQGVRSDPLLDHRTTSELPSAADIVIIGSGVSILHQ